ncbi:MAG: transposase [Chloroflexi bacterium]|nr:transposase [Chloroflexota bacterium]
MRLNKILRQVIAIVEPLVKQMETQVKAWTKPTTDSLIGGAAADLVKSREQLIMENALLRQQVIVLQRHVARPQLTAQDRGLLVVLASRVQDWKNALQIVKPETVLRWHRAGFKLFWRQKSKGKARKTRIAEEAIALIQQMAIDNRRWGTKRIRGELLKLGLRVNRDTIRRYMRQARRKLPPKHHGQSWATFLANHALEIWACDFVQTYDLFFRTVFLFFIIEHGSRRVVQVGVTRNPTDEWVAQQVRNATPFGEDPRFLICDNDDKFGLHFEQAVKGAGIDLIHTPPYAPKANAICERFIGSVRRECLDHILILSEKHVRRVIHEYCAFFNQARPHQGIGQQIPSPSREVGLPEYARREIIGVPILNGLHHDYQWVA